jgi:hypothetical protein
VSASLVVVNEHKPRRVQLFALPALKLTHDLKRSSLRSLLLVT